MVEAIFGPVILSFPVVPLIVTVSEPLVNVLALRLVKDAVVPEPTLIIRLDVPADVSVKSTVSPVNWAPVKAVSYTHLTLPTKA